MIIQIMSCSALWEVIRRNATDRTSPDLCVRVMAVRPYCSGVQLHFELLQVQPVFGLAGVQVVVEVTSCVAETVELPVWSQQDGGGGLLIGHTRVSTLPAPAGRQGSQPFSLREESGHFKNSL